ncbi:hypothetical protein EXIGLDRAFT_753845 [Exidia glandulosa HHB12029]|uniref:Yeast cell wall synthesis Kre9/Knh1-like N-terminal domain-containing protein n=1 Tax=Exidia glandulosa HHB12029 TaxID=1314781 RepID=A0A165DFC5_EXIGL|nr:hypothetical protein EXIGLDRAFT_753845 [Exidia glandulosa HHB12029]
MKFTTSFTTLLSVLTASTVLAAPVQESRRDIWSPHIIYPHEGTVWQLGARHNVTWDTSDAPANISNAALIFLRKGNTTFSNDTLASGFDLRAGRTEITVPSDFAPGTDYRVVLFGDSGNWSPQFTITQ